MLYSCNVLLLCALHGNSFPIHSELPWHDWRWMALSFVVMVRVLQLCTAILSIKGRETTGILLLQSIREWKPKMEPTPEGSRQFVHKTAEQIFLNGGTGGSEGNLLLNAALYSLLYFISTKFNLISFFIIVYSFWNIFNFPPLVYCLHFFMASWLVLIFAGTESMQHCLIYCSFPFSFVGFPSPVPPTSGPRHTTSPVLIRPQRIFFPLRTFEGGFFKTYINEQIIKFAKSEVNSLDKYTTAVQINTFA